MSPWDIRDRLAARFGSLSPRDRRAIVLGAVIVIPALLWAGAVRPWLGRVEDVRDRLAAESNLLAREHGIIREAPALPAQIDAARDEIDRIEARLIRAENPAMAETGMTSRLERLARGNRVLLQEVRSIVGSPPGSLPDGIVPVYLSVTGESDFEGVLAFLNAVEQDEVRISIDGITLGPAPAGGESEGGRGNGVQPGAMKFTALVVSFMVESPPDGDH
jgi:hypothetical protein